MGTGKQYLFPPFRLDSANQQLWCGDTEVYLRRKTFDVLHYLVEHRAQLVSKAAMLDAVWPEIVVSVRHLRGSGAASVTPPWTALSRDRLAAGAAG